MELIRSICFRKRIGHRLSCLYILLSSFIKIGLVISKILNKCGGQMFQISTFYVFQWVYNILEGKSEQDRIVYDNKCERDGFVLLPDLKWDGITKETLYLLAIVRRRGIKSLRDLDETHLPLLKRIRDEGKVRMASYLFSAAPSKL